MSARRLPPTFAELCQHEPELINVLANALAERDRVEGLHGPYCHHPTWKELRVRLRVLVGPGRWAHDPDLSTLPALWVAQATVWTALPRCRGTSCPWAVLLTAAGQGEGAEMGRSPRRLA
jgi:hypothetical protein